MAGSGLETAHFCCLWGSMLSEQVLKKIEDLAGQVATREGCRLYDIEFFGASGHRTLRVLIDKDQDGVGIDDCSNVSKGLNLLLDVEDLIPGAKYMLEVSSPGVERPLKQAWHFQAVVGKKIWLKTDRSLESFGVTAGPLKAAKQLTEVLQGVEDQGIRLAIEGQEFVIPFVDIVKAQLVFEFDEPKKKKK